MDIKKEIYKNIKLLTKQSFNDQSNIFEIGVDSLDLVELVVEAESKFNISIKDEELENIKTVGDIITLFSKTAK